MSSIITSKYKPCRRYGIDFWSMNIPKAKLLKVPGDTRKTKKSSLYKQQLSEKQKLYYYYFGISNKQMRNAYRLAIKTEAPQQKFIYLIESRLHAYIMRASSINSPFKIKQMINHRNVYVNGKKCTYKSYVVKNSDVIEFNNEKLVVADDYSKKMTIMGAKPMPFTPNIQMVFSYFKR